MTELKYISSLMDGQETKLQQAIHDYLMSNPKGFFNHNPQKYNLLKIIDQLFQYLDFAYSPKFYYKKEQFQGNSVKSGMVLNFIQAFKILFLDTQDENGKIRFESISKENLYDAYSKLNSGMESFGLLVALKNNWIEKYDPKKEYMLGKFYVPTITNKLVDRCRFQNEGEVNRLKDIISNIAIYRNIKAHQNEDNSYLWAHIYDMMMFMCVSIYVSYIIWQARYGGVRYCTSVNGKLTLFYKQKQITIYVYGESKTTPQFTPVFQINLPEQWAEDFNCRIVFESEDGKLLDSRSFDIKKNNFCTFIYQPQNKESDIPIATVAPIQLSSKPQEPNAGIPRVMTKIDYNILKSHPFMGGDYIGTVDEKSLPHGHGTYSKQQVAYCGRFEHGKPVGTFSVKCENTEQSFIYSGTLTDDFKPKEGILNYTKENKSFEGVFNGWAISKGLKRRDGERVYEGEFHEFKGVDGESYSLYHGHGILYEEDSIFEGEFVFGRKQGKGTLVYKDSNRPPVNGIWSEDILIEAENNQSDESEHYANKDINDEAETETSVAGAEATNKVEQSVDDIQKINAEDSEPVELCTVMLELPEEPIQIKYADGKLLPFNKEEPIIEVEPEITLTAELLSDERIHVDFKTSADIELLQQWNIAQKIQTILAELPEITGNGKLTLLEGEYEGEWNIRKQPHGMGCLHMKNGNIYTGKFNNGVYHGRGEIICKNGDKLEGVYSNGLKEGEFILTTAHGKVRKTYWSKGELIS